MTSMGNNLYTASMSRSEAAGEVHGLVSVRAWAPHCDTGQVTDTHVLSAGMRILKCV